MHLLSDDLLQRSTVVANNTMNRQRKLVGVNSYEKEIGFQISDYLLNRCQLEESVFWLDLCCGEGNAPIQLARSLQGKPEAEQIHIVGLDLVGMFSDFAQVDHPTLSLVETDFESWQTTQKFDLITCIHGLHYIGDKLGAIQKIASLLKPDGRFVGNLSFENLLDEAGNLLKKPLLNDWKTLGWSYRPRRRLLEIPGNTAYSPNFTYLGADDQAGPNYTGQPVVHSIYLQIN
ncbi:class I SAM-dependent methyltransferase [Pontibacter sp. G13]|uniref:class I SAM-dependent methyltransferase n=1 Tax=Pontibacter sp. G13 TaxID=3074898 RepID=UPI00288C33B2|nr:class I SAM-dependent methyltransferase [Pontibacter sp. G13]WNJ18022.1 class I SAM-dependent methyltransferase [Pontibacter sp. G13]